MPGVEHSRGRRDRERVAVSSLRSVRVRDTRFASEHAILVLSDTGKSVSGRSRSACSVFVQFGERCRACVRRTVESMPRGWTGLQHRITACFAQRNALIAAGQKTTAPHGCTTPGLFPPRPRRGHHNEPQVGRRFSVFPNRNSTTNQTTPLPGQLVSGADVG